MPSSCCWIIFDSSTCNVYLMQYSIFSPFSLLRGLKQFTQYLWDSSTITLHQVPEILTVWHFLTHINTASSHLFTRCLRVHLAILLPSNMSLITCLCCIPGGLVAIHTHRVHICWNFFILLLKSPFSLRPFWKLLIDSDGFCWDGQQDQIFPSLR